MVGSEHKKRVSDAPNSDGKREKKEKKERRDEAFDFFFNAQFFSLVFGERKKENLVRGGRRRSDGVSEKG